MNYSYEHPDRLDISPPEETTNENFLIEKAKEVMKILCSLSKKTNRHKRKETTMMHRQCQVEMKYYTQKYYVLHANVMVIMLINAQDKEVYNWLRSR